MSDNVRTSLSALDTLPSQNLYLILLRKIRYLIFLRLNRGYKKTYITNRFLNGALDFSEAFLVPQSYPSFFRRLPAC